MDKTKLPYETVMFALEKGEDEWTPRMIREHVHALEARAEQAEAALSVAQKDAEALKSGLIANGCEIVEEGEDVLTGEKSGPWVLNTRAEAAEKDGARYRYWRSTRVRPDDVFGPGFSEQDVDAVIDAAIAHGGAGEGCNG